MTEVEEKVSELQRSSAVQDARVDALNETINNFINEMRDRDNQRAAAIEASRAEMKERTDQLSNEIRGIGNHVRNLTIAAMVGIGAIAFSVVSLVWSVNQKYDSQPVQIPPTQSASLQISGK